MPSVTRTPLCTVKGCPAPNDPNWHIPWCQDILDHECFGGATHQHVPKRSQGGKKIVACLCAGAHDTVDNGYKWGNAVTKNAQGAEVYRLWDVVEGIDDPLIERILPGQAESAAEEGMGVGLGAIARADDDVTPSVLAPSSAAPSALTKEVSDEPARDDRGDTDRVDTSYPRSRSADSRDSGHHHPSSSAPLTHEQRITIAAEIKAAQQQRQWRAGDTANAWRAELGESAEQYICDFGYTHESISNIMRVCEAIPSPYRSGLSFSHHTVVYRLDKEEMEAQLERCEEEGWTVAEFRRQVHGEKKRIKRWTLEEVHELLLRFKQEHSNAETCHRSIASPCPYCSVIDELRRWLKEQG